MQGPSRNLLMIQSFDQHQQPALNHRIYPISPEGEAGTGQPTFVAA